VLLEGRSIASGTVVNTDVCVIGAGAAGITIALSLANTAINVVVLESGGLDPSGEGQDQVKGEVVGLPYYPLESTRLRCFGGSTMHWGGWSRPFEPIDFEQRPWVPHSGWPITRATLDPYYLEAQELCQLGHFDYAPAGWDLGSAVPLPLAGDAVATKLIQFSPPTRFGVRYRARIEAARNVSVYLNSTTTDMQLMANGAAIDGLDVHTSAGNSFRVVARSYILAAGGIDNPRLLLSWNRVHKQGIGNAHDLVGRFFGEHIQLDTAGVFPTSDDVSFDLYQTSSRVTVRKHKSGSGRGANVMGYLTLSDSLQRARRTLNYSCDVLESSVSDYFLHADRAETTADSTLGNIGEGLRTLWHNLSDAANVGFGTGSSKRFYKIVTTQEQAPNPSSRVTLAEQRDAFGLRRPRLDWRLNDLDRHTIGVALDALASAFGGASLAKLRAIQDFAVDPWPKHMVGSWHHCGTTRMHDDPKQGVVDANCRVHGIDNLYVAGSSVFTTTGNGNPTLTVVALALRLAEHIKKLRTAA
jgi:choline dehydrogenase-like flavoprotein